MADVKDDMLGQIADLVQAEGEDIDHGTALERVRSLVAARQPETEGAWKPECSPQVYDLLCVLEVAVRRMLPQQRGATLSAIIGSLDAERTASGIARALAASDPTLPQRGEGETGWVSVEERPLVPGEQRLMALRIRRNGEPDWDIFVGTPSDEEDDEWSSESFDPGWAPSEVEYSSAIRPLPQLPEVSR